MRLPTELVTFLDRLRTDNHTSRAMVLGDLLAREQRQVRYAEEAAQMAEAGDDGSVFTAEELRRTAGAGLEDLD